MSSPPPAGGGNWSSQSQRYYDHGYNFALHFALHSPTHPPPPLPPAPRTPGHGSVLAWSEEEEALVGTLSHAELHDVDTSMKVLVPSKPARTSHCPSTNSLQSSHHSYPGGSILRG